MRHEVLVKNLIYLVSLTLFLVACNNLSDALPPGTVSPGPTATPTLPSTIGPTEDKERTSTANVQLPEEISQGMTYTLAQQFRINPDEIELISWQQTTWPNSCRGFVRRQPCLPGEIPGDRLTIDIKGQVYEFHSSTAEPLNLRLVTGPEVNIEEPALLWEGESALLGGAEEGSCLSLSLTTTGQGSLGVCDGPQRAVELTGEQFAQPELWQDWLSRFCAFEADTMHGRVVFQGQDAETASPAWQRALAAWAQMDALELNDGRSGASWRAALAWQQPLSDRHR